MERQVDAAALMSTAASDARPITARGSHAAANFCCRSALCRI